MLIGHEQAWQTWRASLASERMHHAWILGGPRGVGKASFAMAAARELVAEPGVSQPGGSHPDIIVVETLPSSADEEKKREEGKPYQRKRNIAIDQVRALQQRLTTRPTLGARRAIIIDPADDLERSAANALLKSLEEPPQGTYFLLVTHRLGRLLPTIRSRCRLLQFSALADVDVDSVLRQNIPQASQAAREAAIAVAAGSPGTALDFVEMDLGDAFQIMTRIAAEGDQDFVLRGALASAIGARPDRSRQLAAIDLARAVLAARMPVTPVAQLAVLSDVHGQLVRLGAQAPSYNFDPGLLVMELGTLLASVARPRDRAHV